MSKNSRSLQSLPQTLPPLLTELGKNIAIARKRRRMTLKDMAERMRVSIDTVQRLERGDAGISLGIMTTALWVLGVERRLSTLIAPETDSIGMGEDIHRLPKTVRPTKTQDGDFDF